MNYVASFKSPVGNLLLQATERGLVSCDITEDDPSYALEVMGAPSEPLEEYAEEIDDYFAGVRRTFSFPLDIQGTDFQIATWYALRNIPYGETRTYAQIADLIGRPGAARAVGTACHVNPLAIVIPCHRVVAANSIGGYGFGLPAKRFLLRLEGCKI
jgi:methylated-DNA-[protein]-cysteine S-methyltransferase